MRYCNHCGNPTLDSTSKVIVDIKLALRSYKGKNTGELNALAGKKKAVVALNTGLSIFFSNYRLPLDMHDKTKPYAGMELFNLLQDVMSLGETRDLEFDCVSDLSFRRNPLVVKALKNTDPQKASEELLKALDEGAMGEYVWYD